MNRYILFFLLLSLQGIAQKQFKNGLAFSVGTVYLPENDMYLTNFTTFSSKPNFGFCVGYEREFGNWFSAQISTSYFFGKSKIEGNFRDEFGNPMIGELTNTLQRYSAAITIYGHAVTKKKYAFTPGAQIEYGQTFQVKTTSKDASGQDIFPTQKENTNNPYTNASLLLTNRFVLNRLRSERKGTFGELSLLVSPSFIYNISIRETADFVDQKENIFGVGFMVGLNYGF